MSKASLADKIQSIRDKLTDMYASLGKNRPVSHVVMRDWINELKTLLDSIAVETVHEEKTEAVQEEPKDTAHVHAGKGVKK